MRWREGFVPPKNFGVTLLCQTLASFKGAASRRGGEVKGRRGEEHKGRRGAGRRKREGRTVGTGPPIG